MNVKPILVFSLFSVLLFGVIPFDDAFAQRQEAVSLNGQPFKELDQRIVALEESSTSIPDSFFDVFFRDAPAGFDSFFDIFIDAGEDRSTMDSFFDIFTELDARDQHFETEIVAMDLRGESCPEGSSIRAINLDSSVDCEPDTDTKYSGMDFATSGQSCSEGSVVGVDDDGNLVCDDSTEFQVDSFFDIFYDIGADGARNTPDTVFEKFTNTETGSVPDSFFDVWTEIDARDHHFDTEIVAMDLRGESCVPGSVVVGVDDLGNLRCELNYDNDSTNELQTLSLSGQDLSISGGNTVTLSSGDAGIRTYTKNNTQIIDAERTITPIFIYCDSGDKAVGGGWSSLQPNNSWDTSLSANSNAPFVINGESIGWNVVIQTTRTSGTTSSTVFVICQDLTP